MMYAHVIFDLDGTLVDSSSEIYEAAVYVCREHNLKIPTFDYIRSMTGSPPRLFFLDHGCRDDDVDALVIEFRSYLADHAGDPNRVFTPVLPLLTVLHQRSIRLSIATTKPTSLAVQLLGRYGLLHFFSHVQGTDAPLRHKPHPDIIYSCIKKTAAGGSSVMVGDTTFDVEAAHNASIDSIAVCTGAHSYDLLTQVSPSFLLHSLDEFLGIFSTSL